jgi:hypothetical protein
MFSLEPSLAQKRTWKEVFGLAAFIAPAKNNDHETFNTYTSVFRF